MPKQSPLLLHKICRRKGGFFMYCQQPYQGQFNRFGPPMGRNMCGGGCSMHRRGGSSTFVLIVVLFILLIIVGKSFV